MHHTTKFFKIKKNKEWFTIFTFPLYTLGRMQYLESLGDKQGVLWAVCRGWIKEIDNPKKPFVGLGVGYD